VEFFERPNVGERAVLVHVNFHDEDTREELDELKELAISAGAEPVAIVQGSRRGPDSKYFVGVGKADEVRQAVEESESELVIFNHALSPSQERNLERLLSCRVLDRTGLILDIFAQRAHTFEGKLQVELAQLRHLSTRLVRGWTHLERQKGGIGLRGPGETQLETDRRLIAQRIKQLNKRLDNVSKQRGERRRSRRKSLVHTVSLVGYTNAGKSTLFNALTESDAYAADQLFATLDPTLRKLELKTEHDTVLIDTVGFIRHLPHNLVAAFRSTLEETQEASVLLHVIDAHTEGRQERIVEVNSVLKEVGAEGIAQIEVYNKIDLMPESEPHIDRDDDGRPLRVWLSAATGAGLDLLRQAVTEYLQWQDAQSRNEEIPWGDLANRRRYQLLLAPTAGRLRTELFKAGVIEKETHTEQGEWLLEVVLWPRQKEAYCRQDGCRCLDEPSSDVDINPWLHLVVKG
jgi:GTP-binding protein HflX